MENMDGRSADCVRVAVNIRPLITSELLLGCTDCISVVTGEPQVQIGSHTFTYDYVYGSTGPPSSAIYEDCVAPLIDALFNGYNATVLAYGQTGSGKTYTMGTNYNGEGSSGAIIPKVLESIFSRVSAMKESTEFLIRVSFIEIFKEEVFDLLDSSLSRGEVASSSKPAVPVRVPIQIRETASGGITLAGVTEAEVKTQEEITSYLSSGSLSRATGSTNMNSQSSRSHAIFTITMEQKNGDDILSAKLHLVDLAGSERAKRTGADGMRLKEGIHINKGLLALGNVISALGDEKKRKEGGHVPYRDSKLTRLLQDSLGGNTKTVMIACVSPADTNAEETLNTLKYANRARNIQNKAIINRDPVGAQVQAMRSQIDQLQAELLFYRGDSSGPFEELQIYKQKISLLEARNAELQQEVKRHQVTCDSLTQRAFDAQVEKDQLIMKLESIRNGKSWDEIDSNSNQDYDLVKSYVAKIQDLEGQLLRLKPLNTTNSRRFVDCVDSDYDGYWSKNALFACDEMEDDAKELEHSSLQEKLDKELEELDKKLEQKEAEMKHYNNPDTSVLRHHFEKKLLEMEQEKKLLQKEIEELKWNLANISSTPDDGAQKLKQDYLQKLNALEAQVTELKKKQDAQAQVLKQKQKSDEAAKRLQDEIHRIKAHKVQLQQKIKQEAEQFRLWKASREKEVMQLRKEGRRNEYEMHKLLALNQRQKMVLQRKAEEASLATKRLKELMESRRASSRETLGVGGGNGSGIKALMKAIEHELELTLRVHEVRSEYEHQVQERAKIAEEIARLKEEAEMMRQNNARDFPISMSPGARNSRIFALENMLSSSSATLVSMASHLSEAEERDRTFSGKGRWNQVRSITDAKNLMNYLFDIASSSRCLLRDKEVMCREKDMEIRDLKEKVFRLSTALKQSEMVRAELTHQLKLQNAILKRYSESAGNSEFENMTIGDHKYDLRSPEQRRSTLLQEDMDISDIDSDDYDDDVDNDIEATDHDREKSGNLGVKKGKSRSRHPSNENNQLNINSSEDVNDLGETAPEVCCNCTRTSSCKTTKCKCKATGSSCGNSCVCLETKCANRAISTTNESQEPTQPGLVERTENNCSIEETDEHLLATQGVELLQGALADMPPEIVPDQGPRKPLSDIGNALVKSNAPKGTQKKKLQKATILLVPHQPPSSQPEYSLDPNLNKQNDGNNDNIRDTNIVMNMPLKMPSSRPENAASAPKAEGNFKEPVSPLKLRAMRKAAGPSNSGMPFWDKNASKSGESVNNRNESEGLETRSPLRPKRTMGEKENKRR
ncbi:PREDICTED: kinesin-like protein KIN-4C isoform X3 [Lupinus angustifolius]|uniref:kinesin-like protein KIN-4C isoform X3 n=1 Tax=Lupinus angustifolius TaxID=3871 RepID=UPI00092E51A7|nr:PREDICTED: kinesin-like protein KIN-4C isoform X3 [Lupinus angustifolius]